MTQTNMVYEPPHIFTRITCTFGPVVTCVILAHYLFVEQLFNEIFNPKFLDLVGDRFSESFLFTKNMILHKDSIPDIEKRIILRRRGLLFAHEFWHKRWALRHHQPLLNTLMEAQKWAIHNPTTPHPTFHVLTVIRALERRIALGYSTLAVMERESLQGVNYEELLGKLNTPEWKDIAESFEAMVEEEFKDNWEKCIALSLTPYPIHAPRCLDHHIHKVLDTIPVYDHARELVLADALEEYQKDEEDRSKRFR